MTPILSFKNNLHLNAQEWQNQVRQKFLRLIHYDNIPVCEIDVQRSERIEIDSDITAVRHLVKYEEFPAQPVYELTSPQSQSDQKPLLALHGHGLDLFGDTIYAYLKELPKRGYRCYVPVLYGTMERQTLPVRFQEPTEFCREWQIEADGLGCSLLSLRLLDLKIAYELASKHTGIKSMPVVGLSMGAELAFYFAAIQPDVTCCIGAGFFNTFEGLLINKRNCHCYSIFDWKKWFDMPDIVGCIAPRPLMVMKGREDPTMSEDDVNRAVSELSHIYGHFEAESRLSYQTYPGGHILHIEIADQWLQHNE